MTEVREKNREPNLIVFAKQSFSPMQKDIFTLAVMQIETGFNVQPDLFQNKTVTVTHEMLSTVTTKNFKRLRDECKSLSQKLIEIVDDVNEEFEFIVPFPRIKYSKGVIELTMLSDVAQKFLELKNGYSDYYIRESLGLEQFNKKRLYELFSSYKGRKINVWTVYDDELKRLLGMDVGGWGKRHKEFYQKIILVCLNAINEKTSLTVTHERDKDHEGYYTTFTIAEKNKVAKAIGRTEREYKDLNEKDKRCFDAVKKLGVSPKLIMQIVEDHQPEFWKWMVDNKINLDLKNFRNPAAVLLVHLDLVEGKSTAKPKKVKTEAAPIAPQTEPQQVSKVKTGVNLRKTETFTNETDMIAKYDVIRQLSTDDIVKLRDNTTMLLWSSENPDVTKIASLNNKDWFACKEHKTPRQLDLVEQIEREMKEKQ